MRFGSAKTALVKILVMLVVCVSVGCVAVPYPRINTRSDEVEGQIFDAKTKRPIAGAAVQPLTYHLGADEPTPLRYPVAKSDARGYFKLPRSREFRAIYIVMGPCGAGLDQQSDTRYKEYLVSKEGYATLQLSYLSRYAKGNGSGGFNVGQVYLQPGKLKKTCCEN